jgi:TolA-binding protein
VRWEGETVVPPIAVVDFFAHGQIGREGLRVAVHARQERVPAEVFQVGPGDYCRVAFQTLRGQRLYHVYYGGEGDDAVGPAWTDERGLRLETRQWRDCDLNRLESVRDALALAPSVGIDYVAQVYHRSNPFAVEPAPLLSCYRGTLVVPSGGQHTFFTSSQDCSFLLIDGRQVVAAPGAHGPIGQARNGGQVNLAAGAHRFAYYHAARGADACMVAAWQPPGQDKPSPIPASAFQSDVVGRMPAIRLEGRPDQTLPDFRLKATGDVPLADNPLPLVRVQFADMSTPALTLRARLEWDFGDGQTSSLAHPEHVYLHPGEYLIKLSVRQADRTRTTAHRLQIAQPVVPPGGQPSEDQLADYLPMLHAYQAERLGPTGLVQLVMVWLEAGQPEQAAAVAEAGLTPAATAQTDDSRWEAASVVGPVLRDELHDPARALALWRAAGNQIQRPALRARCAVEAAEIALHDLLQADAARRFLDFAAAQMQDEVSESASRLHRVLGDWHARRQDAPAARAAYRKAAELGQMLGGATQQNAWRGAYSRSVESFLREGELGRARDELRGWQRDFPEDILDGYLPLLWARYHLARKQPRSAAAVANDALAVSPAAPYADQLLFLVAECELADGRPDRARAAWQALLTDYPGSPLVPRAREEIARQP